MRVVLALDVVVLIEVELAGAEGGSGRDGGGASRSAGGTAGAGRALEGELKAEVGLAAAVGCR